MAGISYKKKDLPIEMGGAFNWKHTPVLLGEKSFERYKLGFRNSW